MLHNIRIGVDHLHSRTDKVDGNELDSKLKGCVMNSACDVTVLSKYPLSEFK